jgi:hypothetical protein
MSIRIPLLSVSSELEGISIFTDDYQKSVNPINPNTYPGLFIAITINGASATFGPFSQHIYEQLKEKLGE